MYKARHKFGSVGSVTPESLGVPGKRIFRILIDGVPPTAATLWVEKEQLYGIAVAMQRMLQTSPEELRTERGEEEEGVSFSVLDDPDALIDESKNVLEFKVGRLGIAFGPGEDYLTLFFHDALEEEKRESLGGESDEQPTLQISMTRAQSEAFIEESFDICAGGRGTDALSRQALVASGKVDPNQNGHFRH